MQYAFYNGDRVDFPEIDQINNNIPLSQRLVIQLRTLISEGTLPAGSHLPNENQLAERFNVSRSTIRTALQTLEKAGFVIKKRGVGTFVSNEPLKANNLSLNWGVTDVIRSVGAEPGSLETKVTHTSADEHIAQRLHIDVGTPLLYIDRIRTADDRRVVYTQDYIPISLVKGSYGERLFREVEEYLDQNYSLYSYVERSLLRPVHHAIAHISPLTADEKVASKLSMPIGAGILYLEQVDYDSESNPLWLAREFHVANAFTFTVYRST
jgi:GntR family transcriptional regulator